MKLKGTLLFIVLIALTLKGYTANSPDTATFLTAQEVKISRCIINELGRVTKNLKYTDSIAQVRQFKIDNLMAVEQKRAEQLMLTTQDLQKSQAEVKKLKRKVTIWKIATIAGMVSMVLLLR